MTSTSVPLVVTEGRLRHLIHASKPDPVLFSLNPPAPAEGEAQELPDAGMGGPIDFERLGLGSSRVRHLQLVNPTPVSVSLRGCFLRGFGAGAARAPLCDRPLF